jgi:hypothetical protein
MTVQEQEWQLDITGNCPSCKASWQAGAIPEEYLHHYIPLDAEPGTVGPTHYSRLIGMEDRDIYDGAHSWMCPDCRIIIPRIMYYHAKWKLKMMESGAASELSFWSGGEQG